MGLSVAKLDPWDYAAKTRNEYAEQVALFMWAGKAERFGWRAANDPECYNTKQEENEAALAKYILPGFGSYYDDGLGKSVAVDMFPAIPKLKWLHAIHNQGHGDAKRGADAKAGGVKAGVYDIFLPVPRTLWQHEKGVWIDNSFPVVAGLYVELKRLKSARGAAGKASAKQEEFGADMSAEGYEVAVCVGWEAARDKIMDYLNKGGHVR